jgi:hypothetical protein
MIAQLVAGAHKILSTDDTKKTQNSSMGQEAMRVAAQPSRVYSGLAPTKCKNEKATRQLGGLFFKGE